MFHFVCEPSLLRPELLSEVVLLCVVVPVVLPHSGVLAVLLGGLSRVRGELLELIVTLEVTEVNLGVCFLLISYFVNNTTLLINDSRCVRG